MLYKLLYIVYIIYSIVYTVTVYTYHLMRNGVVILIGKNESGHNRVANYLRNHGVISLVKKGKIVQSFCSDLTSVVPEKIPDPTSLAIFNSGPKSDAAILVIGLAYIIYHTLPTCTGRLSLIKQYNRPLAPLL